MKSAYRNKYFLQGSSRYRSGPVQVQASASLPLSYPAKRVERSEHKAWRQLPPAGECAALDQGSAGLVRADDPKQHGVFDQYPAYGTSNDLTLNQCLIAGLGVKTDDSCGTGVWTRSVCCSLDPAHERYQVGGTSCKQPSCPICWTMWAHRAADRISCRVDGFKRFERYPPRHLIFSLSFGDVDLEKLETMTAQKAYDYFKGLFIKMAQRAGVVGGALILHHTRTNDKVPRNEISVKKWDWVRNQGSEKFFDFVDFEIHAHIAGYGYLRQPEKGEFLYKNKGPLQTRDDIEKWAYYAISHAPVIPGKKSVVYFGSCSNSKLKPTWTSRMSVPVFCPVCGYPMIYEGTIEPVYMRRTFADWIYSPTGFEDTRTSKGPPGAMQESEQPSKWFSVENE